MLRSFSLVNACGGLVSKRSVIPLSICHYKSDGRQVPESLTIIHIASCINTLFITSLSAGRCRNRWVAKYDVVYSGSMRMCSLLQTA